MRVIVIGSGSRESTLAYKIASETLTVTSTLVVPGNAGINCAKHNLSSNADVSVDELMAECGVNDVVVIGPEAYLEQGVADKFNAKGIKCFGPTKVASRIEWDRLAGKRIMQQCGVATPDFRILDTADAAIAFCKSCPWSSYVIKRLGLCAGKGSFLPSSQDEAEAIIKNVFEQGDTSILVEQRIQRGHEFSATVLSDGTRTAICPFAQDHKRLLEFDQGPNTGGQGSCCPSRDWFDLEMRRKVHGYLQAVVDKLRDEGTPYVGAITANLMVDADNGDEVNILEMNARFGDPETQSILPLLQSSLTEAILQCCLGQLDPSLLVWNDSTKSAVTVVLSAADASPRAVPPELCLPYAAFSRVAAAGSGSSALVTAGSGRILSLTRTAETIEQAAKLCYDMVQAPGVVDQFYFRPDIAARQFRRVNIAVLGSTRGTDLQFLIDRIAQGQLHARITCVLSNKEDAYILERARQHNIPAYFCGGKDFEQKMAGQLAASPPGAYPDLVLLIGFMRILKGPVLNRFQGRLLNVHPSLLPDFAGGMDTDVHQAVLDAKVPETGCTVHQVTREVDAGPICVQLRCKVQPDDTPDTLKTRVQELEGHALCQAVRLLQMDALPGCAVDHYKQAGVDVVEAQRLVDDHIVAIAASTPHPEFVSPIGGFSAVLDLAKVGFLGLGAGSGSAPAPQIAVTVDGVGTKILLAYETKRFFEVGIDLVAMNTNDLLAQFARPIVFADYYSTSRLQQDIMLQVLEGIAEGCRQSDCRLACGETAEMPGLYKPASQFDVAGFAVGAVVPFNNDAAGPVVEGDVLIGLTSSGLHSNGFSLVRKLVRDSGADLSAPPPFESMHDTLGAALLEPTRIYVKDIFESLAPEDRACIKSMAHITGGGFPKNLPRALPKNLTYELNHSWPVPPVYGWVRSVGNLSLDDCLHTFNSGIGFVLVVAKENADRFVNHTKTKFHNIGSVVAPQQSAPTNTVAAEQQKQAPGRVTEL